MRPKTDSDPIREIGQGLIARLEALTGSALAQIVFLLDESLEPQLPEFLEDVKDSRKALARIPVQFGPHLLNGYSFVMMEVLRMLAGLDSSAKRNYLAIATVIPCNGVQIMLSLHEDQRADETRLERLRGSCLNQLKPLLNGSKSVRSTITFEAEPRE